MVFTRHTLNLCKRLYHQSSDSRITPRVKFASKRVGAAIKRRQEHEYTPKIEDRNPNVTYEPFPFKVTDENRLEVLSKLVTPLVDTPYEEQLNSKESNCRNSLRQIAHELYKEGTSIRVDATKLPCQVNKIVKAPILERYRNSDEYSIWRGLDGETLTVGYMAFPISKHGDTVALETHGLITTREFTDKMLEILQRFIRSQASVPVCFTMASEGGWRRFKIRSTADGQMMVIGIMNPRLLKVKTITDERENFRNFLVSETKAAGIDLRSLYFQPCPNTYCSNDQVPYELLHGERSIIETVGNYSIRLTADSHICPNTSGAVVLHETIVKTITEDFELNSCDLILDINCGVGEFSIPLSHFTEKLIGVDESGLCIEDARANAKLNGVENCEFISVNIEVAIERILEKYSHRAGKVIVILRSHGRPIRTCVAQAIRNCSSIDKVICVTSKLNNERHHRIIIDLCSKDKSNRAGPPFLLISATPVDVYPHIHSYETVLALERIVDDS